MLLAQLLIFILPWVVCPWSADPYLEAKALALMAGLWGLVIQTHLGPSGRQPLVTNPWTRWVAAAVVLLGLWHFQWAFLQRTPGQTQIVFNVYSWLPTVSVLVALLAVRALSGLLSHTTLSAQVLTQWWCQSLALTSVYALLQGCGLDQWYVQSGAAGSHRWYALIGSFGNPEYLAVYLAMLLPLPLLFRPRRYLLLLALMLAVILWTRVHGAWLLAGVSLGTYGLARLWPLTRRWTRLGLLLLVALACGAGGWAVWHLAQGDERWQLWTMAWQRLLATTVEGRPQAVPSWTGYGLGSLAVLWSGTQHTWAHNEWLQALVEVGVVTTSVIGVMVAWTTRTAWRKAQTSILDAGWCAVWVAWLAASVIFPVAHWAHTAWVGVCAWGVLERAE